MQNMFESVICNKCYDMYSSVCSFVGDSAILAQELIHYITQEMDEEAWRSSFATGG